MKTLETADAAGTSGQTISSIVNRACDTQFCLHCRLGMGRTEHTVWSLPSDLPDKLLKYCDVMSKGQDIGVRKLSQRCALLYNSLLKHVYKAVKKRNIY
jgi:hypothetical protein